MKECQPVAICAFANGVWLLNVKWRERRKLTGCGNIDKAKGLYEIYQRTETVGTDLEIIMLSVCLSTEHVIISPERKCIFVVVVFVCGKIDFPRYAS